MKRIRAILAALALSTGFLLATSSAQAITLAWGGSGASGVDPLGHTWLLDPDGAASRAVSWGMPGLGELVLPFGADLVTDFHIAFGLPSGVTIDETPATSGTGFETTTRFSVEPFSADTTTLWDRTIMGGDTVWFIAPDPSVFLTAGQTFFVNVIFVGGTIDPADFEFRAEWTMDAVPEPATLTLIGLGLAGIGFAGRRRKL